MVCQLRTSGDSIRIYSKTPGNTTLHSVPQVLPQGDFNLDAENLGKLKAKRSVIQSAISMAMGTSSSRILGFLRDALFYALFPRAVTDSWVVAFQLPNMFRRLLGEGSLTPSFVPQYVEAQRHSPERARQLASAVFSIVFTVATLISIVCFVYMDSIIWTLVGDPRGFAAVPGKVEQTVYLARIMIFYLILVSTYAFHMAVANTHGYFFLPAIGPTLFNLGLIGSMLMGWEFGAYPGATPSLGVIFGGVLQVGVVIWLLWREQLLPRWTLNWRVPGVARVFVNMGPGLFSLGVFQLMTLMNTYFAARLPQGTQSYVYVADRILELPQSLIAVSIGTALLPRFSQLSGAVDRGEFLLEANRAVRILMYLSLPAAVGMYFLSLPMTQALFMRGAFSAEDAEKTASIVKIYSVLMLFSSLSRITTPAFYAMKNTLLPAAVALGVLLNHLILGPFLINKYGLTGLALATSVSAFLYVGVLQIFFHFWIGRLGYGRVALSVLRLAPALAALAAICHYLHAPLQAFFMDYVTPVGARPLALGALIGIGMLSYFLLSVLFGSIEAKQVRDILLRRLRKAQAA